MLSIRPRRFSSRLCFRIQSANVPVICLSDAIVGSDHPSSSIEAEVYYFFHRAQLKATLCQLNRIRVIWSKLAVPTGRRWRDVDQRSLIFLRLLVSLGTRALLYAVVRRSNSVIGLICLKIHRNQALGKLFTPAFRSLSSQAAWQITCSNCIIVS